MGFFSWKTSDEGVSVANTYSGVEPIPVYLLRPDGKKPIKEEAYEGYGDFGGVDVFEILARDNLPEAMANTLSLEKLREIGIGVDCGSYYIHKETGQKWTVFHDYSALLDGEGHHYPGGYDGIVKEFGKSFNEMIANGDVEEKSISDLIQYPLKLSFDPNADYHSLPASELCPQQGYFYQIRP